MIIVKSFLVVRQLAKISPVLLPISQRSYNLVFHYSFSALGLLGVAVALFSVGSCLVVLDDGAAHFRSFQ